MIRQKAVEFIGSHLGNLGIGLVMIAAPHKREGIDTLASVIAAHLAEWEPSPAFVELAIYGCSDAVFTAETLSELCSRTLGSAIARGLFH